MSRDSQGHREEAERLLALAWKKQASSPREYVYSAPTRSEILSKAQVHALLAIDLPFLIREDPL